MRFNNFIKPKMFKYLGIATALILTLGIVNNYVSNGLFPHKQSKQCGITYTPGIDDSFKQYPPVAGIKLVDNLNPDLTLDLELKINDKVVQYSKIITRLGLTASASQLENSNNGTFIEVTPTNHDQDEITLQISFGKIVNRHRKQIYNSYNITKLNNNLSVVQVCDKEKNQISLSIKANDNRHNS